MTVVRHSVDHLTVNGRSDWMTSLVRQLESQLGDRELAIQVANAIADRLTGLPTTRLAGKGLGSTASPMRRAGKSA